MAYQYKGYNPANNKHVAKYNRTHYKPVNVQFSKEFYADVLKPTCDSLGVPVATFIKQAVEHELERITKK